MLERLISQFHKSNPNSSAELRWMLEHLIIRNQPGSLLKRVAFSLPTSQSNIIQEVFSSSHTSSAQKIMGDLSSNDKKRLAKYLNDRIFRSKPLQYILGTQPFHGHSFRVRSPVLIPRSETEEWVANLILLIQKEHLKQFNVLELCTGSGCISLSISLECPNTVTVAVDNSLAALKLARLNQRLLNVRNCRIDHADVFSDYNLLKSGSGYDIIIANPPYVSEKEYSCLDDGVRNWEDVNALVAGNNGLSFYTRICELSRHVLKPNISENVPSIIFEIGDTQGESVTSIMRSNGFVGIKVCKDYSGRDRSISGFRRSFHTSTLTSSSLPSRIDSNTGPAAVKKKVREKPVPPESDECCMSGCKICVWDIYQEELDQFNLSNEFGIDSFVSSQSEDPGIRAFKELERELATRKRLKIHPGSTG